MSERQMFPCAPSVNRDVLAIGEALVDVLETGGVRPRAVPGGSPANVAVGLGRLGRSVTLLTSIAQDSYGREIRSHLEASGVEVLATPPANGRTSSASAVLQRDGSARYTFDFEWDVETALSNAISPKIVHTGSIGSYVMPGAAEVLREVTARSSQSLITFDPNVRGGMISDAAQARQSIESLIAVADVVKASDEDIAWLYPHADPTEVISNWSGTAHSLVCLTKGAGGAFAIAAGGHTFEAAAPKADVVDTVGAGDAFMASLIDSILSLEESGLCGFPQSSFRLDASTLERIMNTAAAAAAYTVGRRGADPPYRGFQSVIENPRDQNLRADIAAMPDQTIWAQSAKIEEN